MRLLDLFCGAGGCSVGYARAGFEVVGVDREHHDDYPDPTLSILGHGLDVDCSFVQADALDVLADRAFLSTFDVVAASPPCPRYSVVTRPTYRSNHPDLIPVVRDALRDLGRPYVIENVEGAAPVMVDPVTYCGSSFGLQVRRHRLFESNVPLSAPPCDHDAQGVAVGVYGHMGGSGYRPDGVTWRGRAAGSLREARDALGIPWMQWDDLTDAIPPAYTEHIGAQLRGALEVAA